MWILDTLSEIGKISPIQVAILFYYAKPENEYKKITDVIDDLAQYFQGFWEPKKGTIYPAIQSLDVRGFLKRRPVKPFGIKITQKGLDAINTMIANMEKQLEAHIKYYDYIIDSILAIDKNQAKQLLKIQAEMIQEFVKSIKLK